MSVEGARVRECETRRAVKCIGFILGFILDEPSILEERKQEMCIEAMKWYPDIFKILVLEPRCLVVDGDEDSDE